MKKTIALLLALVLCLSLCACGTPLEKACKKADKLVSQWHGEGYGGCIYKGRYIEEYDGFAVSMYMVTVRYPSSVDTQDSADYVKSKMTRRIVDELYPELVKVFDGHNVSIAFTLADQNGNNTYSTVLDGEVSYY